MPTVPNLISWEQVQEVLQIAFSIVFAIFPFVLFIRRIVKR